MNSSLRQPQGKGAPEKVSEAQNIIIQNGDALLRNTSREVAPDTITSSAIEELIVHMHEMLARTENGVALAAPQIGVNLRIFIISPKAFEDPTGEHLVYINPTIIKHAKKRIAMDEGCLSVHGTYGVTRRYRQATVRAYDENGALFERGGSGLLAQIFQHEIDHLDGILFIDHAKHLQSEDE